MECCSKSIKGNKKENQMETKWRQHGDKKETKWRQNGGKNGDKMEG